MVSELNIVKAWKYKKSRLYGLAVIAVTLLWPSIPLRSISAWFNTLINLFPTNILYPLLAVLSGSFTALYVYKKDKAKVCKVSKSGTSASIFGVLLGACPACIPALGFFLPLSLTVTLSYLSWIILLFSILILLFVISKQGGFKKD